MKVVVGLGNPGRKYEGTRHNVGFEVAAELARRHGVGPLRVNFEAQLTEAAIGGEKILLVCPQTFMNLSGGPAVQIRDFYKLENDDLLVVCDDFNLPVGKLRIRGQGSSGGQKGLADVVRRLGSELTPRLRIGVGPVPAGWNGADFVLGKFSKSERPEIDISIATAADAVAEWVKNGMATAMNRFN